MLARRPQLRSFAPLAVLALLGPGATSTVVGCGGGGASGGGGGGGGTTAVACTEIGCNDGVTFVVARNAIRPGERVVARACIAARCTTHRFDAEAFSADGGVRIDAWLPPDTLDPAKRHTATLTIREERRTILRLERTVELETSQPNGAGCPPTCHSASVRVTAADARGRRDAA